MSNIAAINSGAQYSMKNPLMVGQLNQGIRYTPATVDLNNPDRTLYPGTWIKGYREGNQFVITHTSPGNGQWEPLAEPARINISSLVAALRPPR